MNAGRCDVPQRHVMLRPVMRRVEFKRSLGASADLLLGQLQVLVHLVDEVVHVLGHPLLLLLQLFLLDAHPLLEVQLPFLAGRR